MPKRTRMCCVVAALLFPTLVFAQVTEQLLRVSREVTAPQPETYGTSSATAVSIDSMAFTALNIGGQQGQGQTVTTNPLYQRYSDVCCLNASVSLPAGAAITRFEISGCDNSATGAVVGVLYRVNVNGIAMTIGSVNSGAAAQPGCASFGVNITGVSVNNAVNSYAIEFNQNGDGTGAVTLVGARVYYKLQISPDPATATFTDVPVGHPQHRFVEALVAAGITSGCGNGNYCPDAPITRGQMAVFLSAALGLQWAP